MRLWIMSDLHLDTAHQWELPAKEMRPTFDVMIVAGDVIPGMDRGVRWLAHQVTDHPVIYVAGNHEFYGEDVDLTVAKARLAAGGTNIHVLQNDAITINGVTFIGVTLWTDFNLFGNRDEAMRIAADIMNDYSKIRKDRYSRRLSPKDTLLRHIDARSFIQRQLREGSSERSVVITHHGPLTCCSRRGYEHDLLSAAYTSHLVDVVEDADLWVYGHTHESRDFMQGRTRVVSNAKGYGPRLVERPLYENRTFDPYFVVEI